MVLVIGLGSPFCGLYGDISRPFVYDFLLFTISVIFRSKTICQRPQKCSPNAIITR